MLGLYRTAVGVAAFMCVVERWALKRHIARARAAMVPTLGDLEEPLLGIEEEGAETQALVQPDEESEGGGRPRRGSKKKKKAHAT
jgi:hypothetical protein